MKEGMLLLRREREARLKRGRREGIHAQITAMDGSRADQMPALTQFPDALLELCIWWAVEGREMETDKLRR